MRGFFPAKMAVIICLALFISVMASSALVGQTHKVLAEFGSTST